MKKELKLVIVKTEYCNFLKKYDKKVIYNFDKKKRRPFVGVLFEVNNCLYFAPLTSPKPKHLTMKNSLDFYRIDNGKLGAINFNNMIPVKENNIEIINHKNINDSQYSKLLKQQLRYLKRNQNDIFKLSKILYNSYTKRRLNKQMRERCCNFSLLEKKCYEYNKRKEKISLTL